MKCAPSTGHVETIIGILYANLSPILPVKTNSIDQYQSAHTSSDWNKPSWAIVKLWHSRTLYNSALQLPHHWPLKFNLKNSLLWCNVRLRSIKIMSYWQCKHWQENQTDILLEMHNGTRVIKGLKQYRYCPLLGMFVNLPFIPLFIDILHCHLGIQFDVHC